jgi:hypothetical protein
VLPATENDYGLRFASKLSGAARFSLEGGQQKLRGFVNGNVLVPREDERTPLATDPFLRNLVERFLAAYPQELPNRLDIDPRALNTNAPQRINTDSFGSRIEASRALCRLVSISPRSDVSYRTNLNTDTIAYRRSYGRHWRDLGSFSLRALTTIRPIRELGPQSMAADQDWDPPIPSPKQNKLQLHSAQQLRS